MRKKTAKKAGEESRRPTLELDNREESDNEDDWNDTEKLIGYRLEDCIRPFVRVVDGKIERSFKKGTVYSPEIRNALRRLRNVVDPD